VRKLILFGSTGFLGNVLRKELEVSFDLVTAGRDSTRNHIVVNLMDPTMILKLGSKLSECDFVRYVAASVGYGKPTSLSEQFLVNSVAPTLILLSIARDIPFVYVSAAGVHGSRTGFIDNDCPYKPDNDYMKSKFLGQECVKQFTNKALILKFGGIFGQGGPSHLGINQAISIGLSGGHQSISRAAGAARRNYIYVKDAARAIRWGLENEIYGEHLIAGSTPNSLAEMIHAINETLTPNLEIDWSAGPAVNDQVISPSAAFPQTLSFYEALIDIKRDAS